MRTWILARRHRRWGVFTTALLLSVWVAIAAGFLRPSDLRQGWAALGLSRRAAGDGVFEVKPYLQPGDAAPGRLSLLWQTLDDVRSNAAWGVELRPEGSDAWTPMGPPTSRRLALAGLPAYRLFRAGLTGLSPNKTFEYRVTRGGRPVFLAPVKGRPGVDDPQRFVVFGDGGAGTYEQAAVAERVYSARPDYVVITGDIVYVRGRVSEYLDLYFPVYNADAPSAWSGAPLLRSTPIFAAPGNHDMVDRNFDRFPDALAYFYYCDPPANGPEPTPDGRGTPVLQGANDRRKAFLDAAGPAYPRAASYTFDQGGAHWVVLDSNPHADWNDPALARWLEADLNSPAARDAAWRFVAMHHPMFNSSHAHGDDQRMRVIAPILERGKVDVVFAGHVHNYQRTRPLRFAPTPGLGDEPGSLVAGEFTYDRTFDGVTHTTPSSPLYIVTGAGGARLYDVRQGRDRASWQPFTVAFVSDVHSFTIVDMTRAVLQIRQVSDAGQTLDQLKITR